MIEEPPKNQQEPSEEKSLEDLLKESEEFLNTKEPEEAGQETNQEARESTGETAEESEGEFKIVEIFPDRDNCGIFEKLSDQTKNFAGGLYERAKMNIVDRAKVMFNEKILDWHAVKAVGLKAEFEESKKSIQQLEAQEARRKEILGKFQNESSRLLDTKTLRRAEEERIELERAINKEKNKSERVQSKLENRNQKKTVYENRRDEICADVVERIDERLEPYEKKLENLKGQREQLDLEIDNFKKEKEALSQEAEKLEEAANGATFKFERREYKECAKKVKEALKESDKLIKEKSKAGDKIDKKIIKFDGKANPWRDKRTEFVRITQRETTDTSVPRRKEEKMEFKRKEVEGTTRIKEEEQIKPESEEKEQEETTEEKKGGAEGRAEVRETSRFKIGDLIEMWNGHFKTELPLSFERFKKVLNAKYGLDDEVDFDFFSGELEDYYFLAEKEGLIDKKKLTKKDFLKYLSLFEDILKRKA